MDVVKFFREDLGEILGVYCDDETIFLVRLTDKVETAEINFELDLNSKTSATFQLAEKIKLECSKLGWKISKVGVVLRDGTAATFQTAFGNIPVEEIKSAVETWARASIYKEARYTSIKVGDEIWMEALPAAIVDEYISAFDKNLPELCALTELPPIAQVETSLDRARFAAEIVRDKKSPNILANKIATWNVKKILLATGLFFLMVLMIFSAKLSYEYFDAATRAEMAQNHFDAQFDTKLLKQDLDAVIAKIKRSEAIISEQDINPQNFNALVKVGKVPDNQIIIGKIKTSAETFELEGVAESPDAVNFYLGRLKNVAPNVKLKNSTVEDGQIFFSIGVNFPAKFFQN